MKILDICLYLGKFIKETVGKIGMDEEKKEMADDGQGGTENEEEPKTSEVLEDGQDKVSGQEEREYDFIHIRD